jgi:hypothetical protein
MTKGAIRAHHGLHLPETSPLPANLEPRQIERADHPNAGSSEVGSKNKFRAWPVDLIASDRFAEDDDAGLLFCGDTQC